MRAVPAPAACARPRMSGRSGVGGKRDSCVACESGAAGDSLRGVGGIRAAGGKEIGGVLGCLGESAVGAGVRGGQFDCDERGNGEEVAGHVSIRDVGGAQAL